jgi:hypothetical protein
VEFKVGDRVVCIDGDGRVEIKTGNIYIISSFFDLTNLRLEGMSQTISFRRYRFKLVNNQTEAKEETVSPEDEIYIDEGGNEVAVDQDDVCSLCAEDNNFSENAPCGKIVCPEAWEMYLNDKELTLKRDGGKTMNRNIATVFADNKVSEGNLVEKHFGNGKNKDFIEGLVMEQFKGKILKEAKRLEDEEAKTP